MTAHYGLQVSKTQNVSSKLIRKRFDIVGSLLDQEVASSASDRQGSEWQCPLINLTQFHLCLHKGGIKPRSSHFFKPIPILIKILGPSLHSFQFSIK